MFSCAYWSSVCHWRNVYLGFLLIFDWVCVLFCFFFCYWVVWTICVFEINFLSITLFANIFSHSIGCLFILFIVSFAMQKLVSLIRSHLFLLSFLLPWAADLRKCCCDLCQRIRLPRWLSGKESACQCRRCWFSLWVGKMPWKRKWQPTPVFLSGKSHGQRSLADYSPWGCKRVGHDSVTK